MKRKVAVSWGRAEVEEMRKGKVVLTLRMVLSWVMGNYDPFGLVAPFLLRSKVMIRRLQGGGRPIPWDLNMIHEENIGWSDLIFPWVAAPVEWGEVHLATFADGSLTAICAGVYSVWPA